MDSRIFSGDLMPVLDMTMCSRSLRSPERWLVPSTCTLHFLVGTQTQQRRLLFSDPIELIIGRLGFCASLVCQARKLFNCEKSRLRSRWLNSGHECRQVARLEE
jgi:hypothetical protein